MMTDKKNSADNEKKIAETLTVASIAKALGKAKTDGKEIWLTDATKARGVGRLRLRATAAGQGAWYFRYSNSKGKQGQLGLGIYDNTGASGLTLKAARDKFGELSKLYQSGIRDLRSHLEHESAEQRTQMEASARARTEAERQAVSGSLQKLMDGYIAHLERQGKQSAQDARNIFRRNVTEEFPNFATMRASEITPQDVSAMMARLIDREAGRTATKLRSYLRAAYSLALTAEMDSTVHSALHGFNLSTNPAALVPTKNLAAFNQARERVLNETELREFLTRLEKQSGTSRDAVMLLLYLGGQRSAQLVRLAPSDVDLSARELTLYDPKGSRKTPRVHLLPLTDRAAAIVKRLIELNGDKEYLITLNGRVHVRTETLSEVVTNISTAMVQEKISLKPFELRDLRRTAETMMARIGISKDIRAHVLSHGLGGVQNRSYDKHDYLNEKKDALEKWDRELAAIVSGKQRANVVQIRGAT